MSAGSASRIHEELTRGLAAGRVHGAYLFWGPAGTGKRATAYGFARQLLEARGVGNEEFWHPDLHTVEPDGAVLKVEQIRDLQRALSLVANEGGRRVALLFEVDRMRNEAANALLKTLEEPPADTTLILLTTAARGLPPTVLSRTTEYRFEPEPEADVEAALRTEGLDADDAWLAAALGGGSAAAARAWADESLEPARALREAFETLASGSNSDVLDFAESFRGGGDKLRARAELFLDVHGAVARRAVEAATRVGDTEQVERWLDRAEAGARARRELRVRNLNPQLLVEGLMIDLRG